MPLMKKYLACLAACLLLVVAMPPAASHAAAVRLLAVVNGTPITSLDFAERRNFLVKTTGINPAGAEASAQTDRDVMQMLIDDVLKRKESERIGITTRRNLRERATALVNNAFARGGNNPDFVLAQLGISRQFAEEKFHTDLLWVATVQTRFAEEFANLPAEAEAERARLISNAELPQVFLDEIILLPGPNRNMEETRQVAGRMVDAIVRGADFAAIARQYSAAGSAQNGGQIGWVVTGRLPEKVQAAIALLATGAVTAPQEIDGAVAIYRVRDRRTGSAAGAAGIPPLDEIEQNIGNRHFSVLSSRYLANLRRSAIIDYKDAAIGGTR